MSLSLGLVGLPNSGKTTIFNALTAAGAQVAAYPFTTIEPNVGVAVVPDPRLEAIAAIVKPERAVPATVDFVDIAGLVEGASHGEGLGNQFLGHIRNVDALAIVLRAFVDQEVTHVYGNIDPERDAATLGIELILADLAVVERRMERIRTAARSGDKSASRELIALERAHSALADGKPLRSLGLDESEMGELNNSALLTGKPVLYVLNVAEDDLAAVMGGECEGSVAAVREMARREGAELVPLAARLECELQALSPTEVSEYLEVLGIPERGLTRLVQAGYRLLDLVTFFTTTGGKEVRAWTTRRGTKVSRAAGQIHSDMEKGFIRAEVVGCTDLLADETMHAAREHGHARVEGRDYEVRDGDIVHIRFNV